MKTMKTLLGAFLVVFTIQNALSQQVLTYPQASQKAKVYQQIGLTDIEINYSSPAVKDRKVWGGIVPYDRLWRVGANENTTFSVSHDVKIEGKDLPAGTYGLHMMPSEKEWTIIFSKDNGAWGSYSYRKANDALTVTVTPKAASHTEWLSFSFPDKSSNSTRAELRWEKLAVSFNIELDVHAIVVANMERDLTGIAGFNGAAWQEMATYCYTNNVYLDKAESYVDRSIRFGKTFGNLNIKSQLLAKQGKQKEADAMMDDALTLANETEINAHGYQLMNAGKTSEALDVFKMNTKKFPKSWNCWDSLAEVYLAKGDKSKAKSYYAKARKLAPEGQYERIDGILLEI